MKTTRQLPSINQNSSFGCALKEREFSSSKYRYGFNGQERQTEITNSTSHYTAEFWMYDSRLGRRWNIDLVYKRYPHQSPYSVLNNNPIYFNDPTGAEGESPKKTEVQKGEGPWAVATRNKISMTDLAKWNPTVFPEGLESGTYMLHPGQQLNVSNPDGGEQLVNDAIERVANISGKDAFDDAFNKAIGVSGKVNGVLSLSSSAIAEMGGLNKAKEILTSGKFQMKYNGVKKTWSLKFNGNQYVEADIVKESKSIFQTKVAKNTKILTSVKVGGLILNVVGIALTGSDMIVNGVNPKNSLDMTMGVYAFVPGYGWIISGVYFIADATIGVDVMFYWFNASMSGWEANESDPNGDGFYNTKKAFGD